MRARYPTSAHGTDFQSTNLNEAVYFHRLGDAQANDRLVYATPDHPTYGHSAEITDDGR